MAFQTTIRVSTEVYEAVHLIAAERGVGSRKALADLLIAAAGNEAAVGRALELLRAR